MSPMITSARPAARKGSRTHGHAAAISPSMLQAVILVDRFSDVPASVATTVDAARVELVLKKLAAAGVLDFLIACCPTPGWEAVLSKIQDENWSRLLSAGRGGVPPCVTVACFPACASVGDALREAHRLDFVRGPFLLARAAASDAAAAPADLLRAVIAHRGRRGAMTLLLYDAPAGGRPVGVEVGSDNRLLRFDSGRRRPAPAAGHRGRRGGAPPAPLPLRQCRDSGYYVCEPSVLDSFKKDFDHEDVPSGYLGALDQLETAGDHVFVHFGAPREAEGKRDEGEAEWEAEAEEDEGEEGSESESSSDEEDDEEDDDDEDGDRLTRRRLAALVRATVARGVRRSHEPQQVSLEVVALKVDFNATLADCAPSVVAGLVSAAPGPFEQVLEAHFELLCNFVRTEADRAACLAALTTVPAALPPALEAAVRRRSAPVAAAV